MAPVDFPRVKVEPVQLQLEFDHDNLGLGGTLSGSDSEGLPKADGAYISDLPCHVSGL